jgi:hypothetical protein
MLKQFSLSMFNPGEGLNVAKSSYVTESVARGEGKCGQRTDCGGGGGQCGQRTDCSGC